MKIMNVAIVGTSYVGLPTGVGLAELGHQVICIDRELSKIKALQEGKVTLYEEGLEDLLKKNYQKGTIRFTDSMQEGVSQADIVILAVGTPPHPVTHEADMRYLYAAATELSPYLNGYTVIANKSTVPVGTADMVQGLIEKSNKNADFDVVSLPEFLREGYAVYDFFNPDRIIVGADTQRAKDVISELYAPLLEKSPKTKVLCVNTRSSETIKYASNSFLATKIHFINEMADFCEKTGADIYEVAAGMGLDKRIGAAFLNPGPGFGGSCFPKDTMAMDFMARQNGLNMTIIQATINGNNQRINAMAERIFNHLPKAETNRVVGILGLAFKEGTDDCRTSPAIQIISQLLEQDFNLTLRVYDPQAMENSKELFGENLSRITFTKCKEEACDGADVLAILTEWPEFRDLDLKQAYERMRHHCIVDCRNMLNPAQAMELGFRYSGVGTSTTK